MVTIYTTKTCHYCRLAKEFFAQHNIAYEEVDATVPENREKVLELTGKLSVPVTVDRKWIAQGFDEPYFKAHFDIE